MQMLQVLEMKSDGEEERAVIIACDQMERIAVPAHQRFELRDRS